MVGSKGNISATKKMATTAITTTVTDIQQLPLVGESLLKKRHDLDDLARKRAALEEIEPKRRSSRSAVGGKGGNNTTKKKKFYVIKPETIFAHCRNQQNQHRRLLRIQKKGMQTRASNKPIIATKHIPINTNDDDDDDANNDDDIEMKTMTETKNTHKVSYQMNSVGAKMVFVVRIRDSVATPKSILNILHNKLQLRNINDGIFVRYDTETIRSLLHCVEPYILYGPINDPSIIHDLIIRRGHAKIGSSSNNKSSSSSSIERIPISNNTMIEEEFQNNPKYKKDDSSSAILCIEDLVHEIYTVGDAFDCITKDFLYPFQLSSAKTDYERRTLQIKQIFDTDDTIESTTTTTKRKQQQYGDCGHRIMEYIQTVL